MKNETKKESGNELEFVSFFEVEELEDRMEFKTWHGTSLEEELAKP